MKKVLQFMVKGSFLFVLFFLSSCVSWMNPEGPIQEVQKKDLKVSQELLDKLNDFKIKPRKHQIIPVHYLYSDESRKGLLLNHGVGSGKTFLALFYSELYQDKSVLIVGPAYLESNWLKSLQEFPVKKMSRYEFVSYEEAPYKLIGRDLSKTILLLDEAHNLIRYLKNYNKEIQSRYTDLYFHFYESFKILALTATPFQTDESDLAYLINLVNGANILPVNQEKFRLGYTKILKDRAFWRGHVSESLIVQNIAGVAGVAKMLGFLSFIPPAIGVVGVILPLLNYVFYPLYRYNLRDFDPKRLESIAAESVSFSGSVGSKGNEFYPESYLHIKDVIYTPEQHRLFFKFASKDLGASDLRKFFPDLDYSDQKFSVLSSTLLEEYRAQENAGLEIGNLFLKDKQGVLHEPMKFKEILKFLKEPLKKTVIYSLFSGNGINLFSQFLDKEGFKGRYEVLSASLDKKELARVIKDYNKGSNKILLLSPEISEGIDLKGTRQIHFLEPISNSSRFEQVKGRTIRYKSHTHLPKSERRVDVYIWKSILQDSRPFVTSNFLRTLWGSSYRHEDFDQRYPELNYFSQYGDGKFQVDHNAIYKYWSPDEYALKKMQRLKNSTDSFREMLSEKSIEFHYRPKTFLKEKKKDLSYFKGKYKG